MHGTHCWVPCRAPAATVPLTYGCLCERRPRWVPCTEPAGKHRCTTTPLAGCRARRPLASGAMRGGHCLHTAQPPHLLAPVSSTHHPHQQQHQVARTHDHATPHPTITHTLRAAYRHTANTPTHPLKLCHPQTRRNTPHATAPQPPHRHHPYTPHAKMATSQPYVHTTITHDTNTHDVHTLNPTSTITHHTDRPPTPRHARLSGAGPGWPCGARPPRGQPRQQLVCGWAPSC